ncbi:MAG: hypothetical protein RIB84_08490 [Sneathiellaceae bacterium]
MDELEAFLASATAGFGGRVEFLAVAPTTPALAVARLRRAMAALAAGQVPDPDDVAWIVDAWGAYQEGARFGVTMDAALGLAPPPFCPPWWATAAVKDRDALLAELAAVLARRSTSGTAKAIAAAARRYASVRWPRECDLPAPPADPDPAPAILWHLHRSGARWPLGWRTLHEILQRTG